MVTSFNKSLKNITSFLLLPILLASLSGCTDLCWQDLALVDTKGPVGDAIGHTMWYTVKLMLFVVIPTICLSLYIPYKFRSKNKDSKYDPEWHHSTAIEAIVWGIPIFIIVLLGIETYKTSHSLDPRKPLISKVDPQEQPLKIQVVALNWKWLFIYPEQGIATINEISIPKDKPVQFLLTSDGGINSFFIPRLGSQLYAMSGMENKLNLMATEEGVFKGMSANYSGYGFSGMRFNVLAKDQEGFDNWVAGVKNSSKTLDDDTYAKLTKKSRDNKVEYFTNPNPLRYKDIIETNIGLNRETPVIHGDQEGHDENKNDAQGDDH